jgi:hypothetical protein
MKICLSKKGSQHTVDSTALNVSTKRQLLCRSNQVDALIIKKTAPLSLDTILTRALADDATAPVISVLSNKTVAVTGSLTSVNLGQATAVDDVNGPVGVSASDQGLFEAGVHIITWRRHVTRQATSRRQTRRSR